MSQYMYLRKIPGVTLLFSCFFPADIFHLNFFNPPEREDEPGKPKAQAGHDICHIMYAKIDTGKADQQDQQQQQANNYSLFPLVANGDCCPPYQESIKDNSHQCMATRETIAGHSTFNHGVEWTKPLEKCFEY